MLSPSVPALKTIEMGDGKHYSDPVLLGIEAGSGRTAEEDGAVWRLVWRFDLNFLRCMPPLQKKLCRVAIALQSLESTHRIT